MKNFYSLFDFVFYLFIALASIATVYELTRFVLGHAESYSFATIPAANLSSPDPQKFDLTPADADINNPQLVTNAWALKFENTGWGIRLQILTLSLVKISFILVVFLILRAFVRSLEKKETFTPQNIRRLQRIGFLFLLIEPYQWMVSLLRKNWMISYFNLEAVSKGISYRIGYMLGSGNFLWNWILVGVLVLVIAEVFKQGLKLKEEVDLTV